MGLQPVFHKRWFLRGETSFSVAPGFKWLWVYGFVEPTTGENHLYTFSHLNADCFQVALNTFAIEAQASPDTPVILILDNARSHLAKTLKIPAGVHFHFLPPYSPQIQPIERLWPLLNQCIANQEIKTYQELEDRVMRKCKTLMLSGKKTVQKLTCFHWWNMKHSSDLIT